MANSLDLEAGNKTLEVISSDQASNFVYGYPVQPTESHADYLLWTRTTSSSSSSSISPSGAASSPVNQRTKSLKDKAFFFMAIGLLLAAIWCAIGAVINTRNYPKFEVDSFSFSPLSNKTRAANWTVGVLLRNTNRYTRLAYEDFQVSVYYKEEKLSMMMVSPLHLGPKEQASVMATLRGHSLERKNSTAAEIEKDRKHGVIKFDVVLEVKITYFFQFPAIGGRKKVLKMELVCLDVQVGVSSNVIGQASMIGGPYHCYSPLDVLLGVLLSPRS